jgi:hypothetical protein
MYKVVNGLGGALAEPAGAFGGVGSGTEEDAPPAPVARQLVMLFRRNPTQDSQYERVRKEGYEFLWPNGDAVSLGFSSFCVQGCRLLGLGRRMQGKNEQLVELGFHPVDGLEAPITNLGPGTRCRRFFLERAARRARLFFFNGTATDVEFDADQDDPRVVDWVGLLLMGDGERQWFDMSARTLA